jgi:hypothetical protein
MQTMPHIEKFMPVWLCVGSTLLFVAIFLAILIVVMTSRRSDDSK